VDLRFLQQLVGSDHKAGSRAPPGTSGAQKGYPGFCLTSGWACCRVRMLGPELGTLNGQLLLHTMNRMVKLFVRPPVTRRRKNSFTHHRRTFLRFPSFRFSFLGNASHEFEGVEVEDCGDLNQWRNALSSRLLHIEAQSVLGHPSAISPSSLWAGVRFSSGAFFGLECCTATARSSWKGDGYAAERLAGRNMFRTVRRIP
jgi:hypothetical protein